MLLAGQGLPKAAPGGYAILDQLPMGVSRAVEGERLRQARETELARSIEEIDAVAEARVHLATPEASVFVRDNAAPSASVILKLQAGRSLCDAQVRSIVNLVASSVPGMKPEAVTIVDQMGALLTKPGGSDGARRGERRAHRVPAPRRGQVSPAADRSCSRRWSARAISPPRCRPTSISTRRQATRESYDKQGALRAETGQLDRQPGDRRPAPPGGIPGALSQHAAARQHAADAAARQRRVRRDAADRSRSPAAAAPGRRRSRATASSAPMISAAKSRSRAPRPATVKRLSVAVLLRDPDKGRAHRDGDRPDHRSGEERGRLRSRRAGQVTVISRKFAGADRRAPSGPAWYDNALAAGARAQRHRARHRAAGAAARRAPARQGADEEARRCDAVRAPAPGGAPARRRAADGIAGRTPPSASTSSRAARGYDDRIGAVRGFTRDNPARAALAVRDMIKADAK